MPARKQRRAAAQVIELPIVTPVERKLAARPLRVDPDQLYTIDEAAVLLCTTRSTLYDWIRRGFVAKTKRGRRSHISGAEVIRFNGIAQL